MSWRLAKSLARLRNQVNDAYPNRSKASDGTIGDAAHSASASDHNPNANGVVCALDLTNDPANGFDVHELANRLRLNRHPNLKYIISNSRIASAQTGWQWVRYNGSNPHSKHVHFSVGNGTDGRSTGNYDSETNWEIGGSKVAKVDTALNRIIHTELEGWDLASTHSGKNDTAITAAWNGKDLAEMVWSKWNNNGAFRTRREAALKLLGQYERGEIKTKAQLDQAVSLAKTEAESETAELKKQIEEARKAQEARDKEAQSFVTSLIEAIRNLFKKG